MFAVEDRLIYLMALLNTNVIMQMLSAMSPTLNFEGGQISSVPVIIDNNKKGQVCNIADKNIELSKNDWDSFETSWDFKKHPLV